MGRTLDLTERYVDKSLKKYNFSISTLKLKITFTAQKTAHFLCHNIRVVQGPEYGTVPSNNSKIIGGSKSS